MKSLDCQICGFSWAFGSGAALTAALIACYVCNLFDQKLYVNVAIVAACVLTVMLGVILAILLLMKKQILPEEAHNENKLHELLERMVADSSIEENCKNECDSLRNEIISKIVEVKGKLESDFEISLNEYKRKIEEEQAQKPK